MTTAVLRQQAISLLDTLPEKDLQVVIKFIQKRKKAASPEKTEVTAQTDATSTFNEELFAAKVKQALERDSQRKYPGLWHAGPPLTREQWAEVLDEALSRKSEECITWEQFQTEWKEIFGHEL